MRAQDCTIFLMSTHFDRLLETADEMIAADERTRGEFYVIPVYQKYIDRGATVMLSHAKAVWDMGTPEESSPFLVETLHGS